MSPSEIESASAVAGLRYAALSHTSFVTGSGNSRIQGQFVSRPSSTPFDRYRLTSNPPAAASFGHAPASFAAPNDAVFPPGLGDDTTPSCTHLRQFVSNRALALAAAESASARAASACSRAAFASRLAFSRPFSAAVTRGSTGGGVGSTGSTMNSSAAGVSPAGVSPAGVSPAEVSPAGVSPAGVSPAGVSPAGGSPVGGVSAAG